MISLSIYANLTVLLFFSGIPGNWYIIGHRMNDVKRSLKVTINGPFINF